MASLRQLMYSSENFDMLNRRGFSCFRREWTGITDNEFQLYLGFYADFYSNFPFSVLFVKF